MNFNLVLGMLSNCSDRTLTKALKSAKKKPLLQQLNNPATAVFLNNEINIELISCYLDRVIDAAEEAGIAYSNKELDSLSKSRTIKEVLKYLLKPIENRCAINENDEKVVQRDKVQLFRNLINALLF